MDVETALRSFFGARHEGIVAVYLFGSEARGTAREDSDVDVGILFRGIPPSTLDSPVFALQADLEQLSRKPVQVVALNTAPAALVHRVLRDGRIVFDGDRTARIRFEVARQNDYFDLLPILRRCTRRESASDADLVALKLARIEALVTDLRTYAKPDRIRTDLLQQRFAEHSLQIAIQCALDVASHIVADDALGVPGTNKDLFAILVRHGWLEPALGDTLTRMVGFRNVLVHDYDDVDLGVVEDAVRHRLGDLLAFVAAVRARLPSA